MWDSKKFTECSFGNIEEEGNAFDMFIKIHAGVFPSS